MDQAQLTAALTGLPLGGLRFYPSIGSTNDDALAWAAGEARDGSLVVADEQTAGRGRAGRRWFTPPGSALAFSLVLRPSEVERSMPGRMTGLGALAVGTCCERLGLQPQIKWPNDVLIGGRKVAGILVELVWTGPVLDAAVIGIGINIRAGSVPPAEQLTFPATALDMETRQQLNRTEVLRTTLAALFDWRSQLGTPGFMQAWEAALAFRGQQVSISAGDEPPLNGKLLGLEPDGSLHLERNGESLHVRMGEIHLRPSNDKIQ